MSTTTRATLRGAAYALLILASALVLIISGTVEEDGSGNVFGDTLTYCLPLNPCQD